MNEIIQPVCQADHVTKAYPVSAFRSFEAVKDVTLSIYPGETLGLVGESGSGKSTLGRQLVALEQPTRGTICYQGNDLHDKAALKGVRTQLQMVFQDTYASLNPRKTVFQTLYEPMAYHGLADRSNGREQVNRLLDMAELPWVFANRYPHALSGGQRQRVCIARALALNPRFVVWDEPVSALDVTVAAQILELMKQLQKELGLTSVFIGHGIGAVAYVSQRLAVMKDGRLVEVGETDQILNHPKDPYTRTLIQAARY
ncbi:MAG: ABC transporter ATP-binding protein [Candidatus Onthomonas sp.]